jgi:hypothetical protein
MQILAGSRKVFEISTLFLRITDKETSETRREE